MSSPCLTHTKSLKNYWESWDYLTQSQSLTNREYLSRQSLCWLHSQTLPRLLHWSSMKTKLLCFLLHACTSTQETAPLLGLVSAPAPVPLPGEVLNQPLFLLYKVSKYQLTALSQHCCQSGNTQFLINKFPNQLPCWSRHS